MFDTRGTNYSMISSELSRFEEILLKNFLLREFSPDKIIAREEFAVCHLVCVKNQVETLWSDPTLISSYPIPAICDRLRQPAKESSANRADDNRVLPTVITVGSA